MWAELFGKETGLSSGKAGSMHLGDLGINFIFTSAIVGSAISQAVGYSLALKMKKLNSKVICYHGEGAWIKELLGILNFSALKNYQFYLCENNHLAIFKTKKRMKTLDICKKVKSFGVHTIKIKIIQQKIYLNMLKSSSKNWKKWQPVFLEIDTYREVDHVGINYDFELGYRKKDKQKLLKV